MLQTLTNLYDQTTRGIVLPMSRVHPNFFSRSADLSASLPPYPDPGCFIGDDFFGSGVACSHLITEDSASPTFPLSPREVDELSYFATQNPLKRSVEPIVPPDIAAPLGYTLFYFNGALENAFTFEQLEARYGSHNGYVRLFQNATERLINERLWDAELGALYVKQAKQSAILIAP